MLARMRGRTGWRRVLAALAFVALALKLLSPAGYMPGSSLSAPIMLCGGQGAMPGMAMAHRGDHAPSPHDKADHPCAFAGLGTIAFATPFAGPAVAPMTVVAPVVPISGRAVAPGHGLAAPPPPSHAPPALRT